MKTNCRALLRLSNVATRSGHHEVARLQSDLSVCPRDAAQAFSQHTDFIFRSVFRFLAEVLLQDPHPLLTSVVIENLAAIYAGVLLLCVPGKPVRAQPAFACGTDLQQEKAMHVYPYPGACDKVAASIYAHVVSIVINLISDVGDHASVVIENLAAIHAGVCCYTCVALVLHLCVRQVHWCNTHVIQQTPWFGINCTCHM